MGKRSQGEPWDKGPGAVTAPVLTVTRDLGLGGGTPCPGQPGAAFPLTAWVWQELWAPGAWLVTLLACSSHVFRGFASL